MRSSIARFAHQIVDKFSLVAFGAVGFSIRTGPTSGASGADFGGGRTNHVWVQHVLARVALKTRRGTGVRGFGGWASFARGKAGGQCGGVGKCVLWTILAFGCVQLVGKCSSSAGKAELFVGFGLVPSFWACRAGSLQVDDVRVPSCWAVGAIPFGGKVGQISARCGRSTAGKETSGGTTKNGVSASWVIIEVGVD
jgi:hypothetical protein